MIIIGKSFGGDVSWVFRNPKPKVLSGHVVSITASSVELEYIKLNFSNLPFRKDAVEVTWSGDFARFLYDNIPADVEIVR